MHWRVILNRFEFHGSLMDSMTVHSSDKLEFTNPVCGVPTRLSLKSSSTLQSGSGPESRRRPTSLNLGIQMLRQRRRIVAMGHPFIDAVMAHSTDSCKISYPSRYIVIAFVNRYINTENACRVSKEFAESGAFVRADQLTPVQGCGNVRVT